MESEIVLVAALMLCGVIWIWVSRHLHVDSPLKIITLILGLVFLLTGSTVIIIVAMEMLT